MHNHINGPWLQMSVLLNFQEFTQAAADAKALTKRPTDAEMLDLYSLFKQATVGDVNTGMTTVKYLIVS